MTNGSPYICQSDTTFRLLATTNWAWFLSKVNILIVNPVSSYSCPGSLIEVINQEKCDQLLCFVMIYVSGYHFGAFYQCLPCKDNRIQGVKRSSWFSSMVGQIVCLLDMGKNLSSFKMLLWICIHTNNTSIYSSLSCMCTFIVWPKKESAHEKTKRRMRKSYEKKKKTCLRC